MPDQLQLRGGTTAEHSTFTGAIKEVTVDTSKKTVVVHDGTTAGGLALLRQDGSNSALALGSEGTPSLKWDANTGIFSPGDDQLAIVTGGNRAITCTSTQAVGVKTSNPNAALHVAGSARVGADSAADAILEIGEGATGNRNSYIDIVGDTTYTDYGLRVIRNNTGANATSELKHRGTGALNFTTQEAAPIVFNTTNSPALTILAGGNVGIGTSGPDEHLYIEGSGDQALAISSSAVGATDTPRTFIKFFGLNTASQKAEQVRIAAAPGSNASSAGQLIISTRGTGLSMMERLRIDESGRLGIGVTEPGAFDSSANQLVVGSGTGDQGVTLYAGTASSSTINFADGTASTAPYVGRILYQHASNAMTFHTNGGTEAVRIDSSQRLLVGTIASPAHQLQVSTDSAGKPSTNTWTIVSDERIKEEIELADLDLCYQAVKNIPLKRFKWKDEVYTEEQVRDRRKLGWIAQDVEAVFPKAVGTYEFKYNQVFEETIIPAVEEVLDDEGNVTTPAQPERIEKGELISEDVIEDCRDLNSDQLYAAMYGAIQKLMVKVETLETELAALKAS